MPVSICKKNHFQDYAPSKDLNSNTNNETPRCIDESGPWPFVTRRIFERGDASTWIWSSRHHRKKLNYSRNDATQLPSHALRQSIWLPRKLNWWIGLIFAIGSLLFLTACICSLALMSGLTTVLDLSNTNRMFFCGSIFFTIAAYLQLYQSANPDSLWQTSITRPRKYLGWRPSDIGWISSALQFLGTLLFNVNTYNAMSSDLTWLQQDLRIWLPDLVGSILFLASGYLAFAETCHSHWSWHFRDLSWRIVFSNLIGCLAFMAAAATAFSTPESINLKLQFFSMGMTAIGAASFLTGALLMLPESTSNSNFKHPEIVDN